MIKQFLKKIIYKLGLIATKDLLQSQKHTEALLQEYQKHTEVSMQESQKHTEALLQEYQKHTEVSMQESQKQTEALLQEYQKQTEALLQEYQKCIIHEFNQNYGISDALLSYKNDIYSTVWGRSGYKVYHAFAQFYNFGDHALAYGVQNIFLKYFEPNARFKNIDVHSTVFDEYKIQEINSKADLFLIGGGGLIDTFSAENEYIMFNITDAALVKLKTPMVLYALGFNNFDNVPLCSAAMENIKHIQKKTSAFSVRNDGSKERLSKYGFEFDEVPDPGFFCDGNHPNPYIDGEYILLQLCYDAPYQRNISDDKFFKNILEVCSYLLQKDYHVVLAPHCYPDIQICEDILKEIDSKNITCWNWNKVIRENNVTEGLGYYKYAKFVIAMRGHGQIIPIGMNIPCISIINHPKHLGLLKKIHQENLCVKVTDENFSTKIRENIEYVENNYIEIQQEYKKLNTQFQNTVSGYLRKVEILCKNKSEDKK